jgi:Transcriptional regulator of heat shock gene
MGDALEVTIGQENEDSHVKHSTIITATSHLDGELLGTIAALGPTRREYAKPMSLLEHRNSNRTEAHHSGSTGRAARVPGTERRADHFAISH